MADLWDRLRAAQTRGAPTPSEPVAAPVDAAPPGWEWVTPLVARRRLRFGVDPKFWAQVVPDGDSSAWDGVLAFDTETTGLSGGAGTVAFLVGWARLLAGSAGGADVEVTQYFLRDHPGEPELIAALDHEFRQASQLVSFNGASFDLPLLKSRWALDRRDFPEVPHRDDLHPARRLWKRVLENCRLGTIETAILGLRRVDDVPGALVPEMWFAYLRSGAAADFETPLEGVLRHHAQDVYSLLCLDLLLHRLRAQPTADRWLTVSGPFPPPRLPARPAVAGLLHPDLGAQTPVDFWGLLALQDSDDADHALEEAWQGGDEAVGMAWADRLKRRRDPLAVEVWRTLWEQRRSYPALVEWAKWLEHVERTPEAWSRAEGLVSEALRAPFLPQVWVQELVKRQERLRRKARPSESD